MSAIPKRQEIPGISDEPVLPKPGKSRRKFLSASVGFLIVAPAAYLTQFHLGKYKVRTGLIMLTNKEAQVVDSVLNVLFPLETFGLTAEQDKTLENMDQLMANLPDRERKEVRLLLWATEHISPVLNFENGKFTNLSPEKQTQILNNLLNHRFYFFPQLVRGLKFFIGMSFFDQRKVQERLGYEGWCGP